MMIRGRALGIATVGCLAWVLPMVVGCTPSDEEQYEGPAELRSTEPIVSTLPYEPPPELRSDEPRQLPANVPTADLNELVAGNTAFSFDLLHALSQPDGDLFFSPYSISLALAMTYGGARGGTATEMADALHYTLPQEQLHPAFNKLDQVLASRGQGADPDDEVFQLHIANAIWAQVGFGIEQDFLDLLAVNYGAGVYLADFVGATETARQTINDWVSHQTEGRIEDLLPAGIITVDTLLVLTNAIYFKAAWKYKFLEESTVDRSFDLEGGGTVTVPMMRQTQRFRYIEGNGVQAVELPYVGDELSMVILLPDPGLFSEISETADGSLVNGLIGAMQEQNLWLELPRFTYESFISLKQELEGFGMQQAFQQGSADFSGISTIPGLHIMAVIHKAFVDVNEAGTEAAAATAVVMGADAGAPPPPPIELIVDRPFLFLIRDSGTGTVLFVGAVENPLS
ncbi:MAG: serpin family protein [bacterium]